MLLIMQQVAKMFSRLLNIYLVSMLINTLYFQTGHRRHKLTQWIAGICLSKLFMQLKWL